MDQDDAIGGRIFTRRELLGGTAKYGLGLAMPRMLAQSSSTWARADSTAALAAGGSSQNRRTQTTHPWHGQLARGACTHADESYSAHPAIALATRSTFFASLLLHRRVRPIHREYAMTWAGCPCYAEGFAGVQFPIHSGQWTLFPTLPLPLHRHDCGSSIG